VFGREESDKLKW